MSDSETERGEDESPAAVMQPAMMTTLYPVCHLNDSNYAAWSLKMEMLLKRESLWMFIDDPPAVLIGENQRQDERAQANIILSMEDDLLVYVQGLTTAKECWDALRAIYVRQSVASRISLLRRLYRTRLELGDSLKAHLRVMKQTFKDLDDKGVQIPEFQKALTVLSSLDNSWDTFALTLETVPEATLTLSYLTERLLEEEEKRAENAPILWRSASTHPTPKTTSRAGEETAQIYAARKCNRCGASDHLPRFCKARKPKRRGKTPARTGKTQIEEKIEKMKCLLVTAILVLFACQLGSALKCYKCDLDLCQTQEDCSPGFDTCIVVKHSGKRVSRCWKDSECNPKSIEEKFSTGTFKYSCCQKDLCNSSPTMTGPKMVISVTSLLTVVWMLWK